MMTSTRRHSLLLSRRTNPENLVTRRAFMAGSASFLAITGSSRVLAQEQPPVIEPIEPDDLQEPTPESTVPEPVILEPDDGTSGQIDQIAEQEAGLYFAETGHNITDPFLTVWLAAGGESVLGMPLSESRFDDDSGAIEQVFEGIILEWDPAREAPWDLHGQPLGQQRLDKIVPASARTTVSGCVAGDANCQFFPETGHKIQGDIAVFWNQSGGAPIFGLPRSRPFSRSGGRSQAFDNVILNVSSSGEISAEPIGREIVEDLRLEDDPAFLPAPPSLGTSTLVTADEGLRLRSAPTTDAEIIAVLPKNAEFVAVTGASGAWIPGYADGYAGYVAAEFLKEPQSLPTVALGGQWDTSVWQGAALSETNLRAKPTTNSRIIKTIEFGAPVVAVDWVKGEKIDGGSDTWALLEDGSYLFERNVGRAAPVEAPGAPSDAPTEGKWIDCNLTQQLLVAYEGRQAVRVAVQTTGKPGWETPEGYFFINTRVANETMESGSIGADEFYKLENVLFTQYFTDVGHALHFAWWKTPETIGRPGSHGCLNLLLDDAEHFWNWAEIGTPVYSHY